MVALVLVLVPVLLPVLALVLQFFGLPHSLRWELLGLECRERWGVSACSTYNCHAHLGIAVRTHVVSRVICS